MKLILHIGAHRTGSTLVQQMLSAAEVPGLAVWSPLDMRAIRGFSRVPGLFSGGEPKDQEARAKLLLLQADLAERVGELEAAGVHTLLISEENMVGTMPRNFEVGAMYADAADRLQAYAEVFAGTVSRVGIGLRDYGSVWNSAYAYASSRGRSLPPAEDARRALLDKGRGWPQVMAAAAKAFPDAELMAWRQEDLSTGAGRIAAALAGLDTDLPPPEAAINSNAARGAGIEMFSTDERDALTKRYNRHLAKLYADPSITWAYQPEGV